MTSETCIVYVLTNEAMPDYVKIGTTRSTMQQRMAQLYSTSVPVPFECHYAGEVEVAKNVEKRLHRAFDKFRINKNREFFEIDPEAVAEIIRLVALRDVSPTDDVYETPDDKEAIQKLEKRAARFNFKMVGLSPGTVLTFKYDENITCTVVDHRNVDFDGETQSLSAAALAALRKRGFDWKAAQGAAFWMYEGKTLKDLRDQMEDGEP